MGMRRLTAREKKLLRGMAHGSRPLVLVGKNGLSDALLAQIDRALKEHELIKIRFLVGKQEKDELCSQIEERTRAQRPGMVGHVAIFFRQNEDPKERQVDPGFDLFARHR